MVQLVNNRPFGMVLTYGGPVSFGWHEPGDSLLDRREFALGDALVGSHALYLPPLSRASVGIRQPTGYQGEIFHIGVTRATLGLDLLRTVGDDVLSKLPGSAASKIGTACQAVLSRAVPPSKLANLGTLRERMFEGVDCFEKVFPELVRDGVLDSVKVDKLASTFGALKKASLVGRFIEFYSVEWDLLDLYADTHWVAPLAVELGWGFSVYPRATRPQPDADAGPVQLSGHAVGNLQPGEPIGRAQNQLVGMLGKPSKTRSAAGCTLGGPGHARSRTLYWDDFMVYFDGPSDDKLTMVGWRISGADYPDRLRLPHGIGIGDNVDKAQAAVPEPEVTDGYPFTTTEKFLNTGDGLLYWFTKATREITEVDAPPLFCE